MKLKNKNALQKLNFQYSSSGRMKSGKLFGIISPRFPHIRHFTRNNRFHEHNALLYITVIRKLYDSKSKIICYVYQHFTLFFFRILLRNRHKLQDQNLP